jgi:ferrous-iron efflux pump FieF
MEHLEIRHRRDRILDLATLRLLAIQRHVIHTTGSTAIKADAFHYAADVLRNLSVIAALMLSIVGWSDLWRLCGG